MFSANSVSVFIFLICSVKSLKTQLIFSNSSSCRDSKWPQDLISPFAYPTYSPIDIDTSTVKVVNTASPLLFRFQPFTLHTVVNTGKQILKSKSVNDPSTMSGGIFGSEVYGYEKTNYFWTNDYRDFCAGSIDESNYPLLVSNYWYNKKYGTFNNALKYRDGVAITNFPVQVEGNLPSPSFTTFENILRKLKVPGSSVPIAGVEGLQLYTWFFTLPISLQIYYAYPGAYVDVEKGNTMYQCATIIHFSKSYSARISVPQFSAFRNILNSRGSPINNVLTTFPSNSRPLVQASGVTSILIS